MEGMKGSAARCQQCGSELPAAGACTACGADPCALTATNTATFIDRLKQLVVPPAPSRPRLGPGEAVLIDASSGADYLLPVPVFKLGRDAGNDLSLAFDSAVSRNHALITYIKEGYWIEDLGSTNGTYLNGKKIRSRTQIFAGDRIVIGKTEFLVGQAPGSGQGFTGYQIECELGRGGMGIVYRAADLRNRRPVAIKLLQLSNLEIARRKARSERFKREAALSRRLQHPNIITVYDVHLGPDKFYYVMELLEGRTLKAEVAARGGRLTPLQFLPILEQVGSALAHAHGQNVVHRDVKPDNIFILPDGWVKLTDFGIARAVADLEEANLTRSGAMLGTLCYSAPEQLDNARKVDARADIFSLGVVAYEVLSGINPFRAEGITQVVLQVSSRQERPLNELVPEVGPALSQVVARAMAKRPAERQPAVADFVDEYRALLHPAGPTA